MVIDISLRKNNFCVWTFPNYDYYLLFFCFRPEAISKLEETLSKLSDEQDQPLGWKWCTEVIGFDINPLPPRLEAQIEQVKSRQEQYLWRVNLY